MSSSENHHVISVSPDDALMTSYLLLVGKYANVPGHLSVSRCSEQNARVNAPTDPHLEREMAAPGTCCDTYMQVNMYDSM